MTDRVSALIVTLERDIRIDDVEVLVDAIKMLRGVMTVETHISNIEQHIAEERVRREFRQKLYEALK